jgi:hypothetical protein
MHPHAVPQHQFPPLPVPTTPAAITSDWLNRALGAADRPGRARITSAVLTRIGEDEGFTGGGLYRVKLTHDRAETLLPETLVAKLSPADPAIALAFRVANGREVGFYKGIGAQEGMPVPRCYHADFDQRSGASILLLQDLGNLRAVSFVDGCGTADAERVIDALAMIHTKWWNSPDLSNLGGSSLLREFSFRECWRSYKGRLAGLMPDMTLPPTFQALGDYIARHEDAVFRDLWDSAPQTCLHRDVQLDNVMFDARGIDETAIILDWQIMGKGCGTLDVGYFLISALHPDRRRACERDLIGRYQAALARLGVADYSLDRCWSDYLKSAAAKLYLTVVATVLLDNSGPHKMAWRKADLQRLVAFCADHSISAATFQTAVARDRGKRGSCKRV